MGTRQVDFADRIVMPLSLQRQCTYPNCDELVRPPEYLCPAHKQERDRKDQQRRGTAAQRGYDRRHRNWRLIILRRDPVCRACRTRISTEADHIIPLNNGGSWALSNGQGMCKPCHSAKTALEEMAADLQQLRQ
jgi:5-methylcytosine-specific restriction protein A